jgi:hypothetical protein
VIVNESAHCKKNDILTAFLPIFDAGFGMQIVGNSGTQTHKHSNKKSRQCVQVCLNNGEDILGVFPHLSLNDDTSKQSESNAKPQNQVVVKKC